MRNMENTEIIHEITLERRDHHMVRQGSFTLGLCTSRPHFEQMVVAVPT